MHRPSLLVGKMVVHLLLCVVVLLFQTIDGATPPPKKWLTLNGAQPEVIARGGFSGMYPDSSLPAYSTALGVGIQGTILYCNLHFTKDNDGLCIRQLNIMNTTTIEEYDPKGAKTYNVNGVDINGYFAVDYTSKDLLEHVYLFQSSFKRPAVFDGQTFTGPLHILKDSYDGKPARNWLNIENYLFYKQFNISPELFLMETLKQMPEFMSSPEIGFLKIMGEKLGGGKSKTKLILTILKPDEVEPTTKKPYDALVKDLPMIKSFASGILVPKEYIWPVDEAGMLFPSPTSLVQDAHKLGLAVYASDFANDNTISYNYSYDPVRECLQFFDNGQFSVDGMLTDFPSTPSEAIGCINPDRNAPRVIHSLIISYGGGASGDYPGSTDVAYEKAIEYGADIIDCPVQMSKDGVAFCSPRADISRTTTALAAFSDRNKNVTEIQPYQGIFSFDLTWDEILTLKPKLKESFGELPRNPQHKHTGKIVTLDQFLELAKAKAAQGVLISIQNVAYLKTKNLDIVGAVKSALDKATLDKQQRIMIQSDDLSVLGEFKGKPNYERVLYMHVQKSPEEVKQNAEAVFVNRRSIVLTVDSFVVNMTNIVPAFHAANLKVYVGPLRNEYLNLAQNYFSDPYREMSTLLYQQVDGFVTEFPQTADLFVRSTCTTEGSPYVIEPLIPGVNMNE